MRTFTCRATFLYAYSSAILFGESLHLLSTVFPSTSLCHFQIRTLPHTQSPHSRTLRWRRIARANRLGRLELRSSEATEGGESFLNSILTRKNNLNKIISEISAFSLAVFSDSATPFSKPLLSPGISRGPNEQMTHTLKTCWPLTEEITLRGFWWSFPEVVS